MGVLRCEYQGDGCTLDIARMSVFGKPSFGNWKARRKTRRQPGATCESVDAAAHKVITDAGFGTRLQTPRPARPPPVRDYGGHRANSRPLGRLFHVRRQEPLPKESFVQSAVNWNHMPRGARATITCQPYNRLRAILRTNRRIQ